MKKILLLISSFFILFSSISIADASIFNDRKDTIPYCTGNECGLEKGIDRVGGQIKDIYNDRDKGAAGYIQDIIKYLLGFLFFAGVVVIIWAGVTILTAGGDDEKVSKAKKIIIYVVLGMIVIFLAGPITNFILQMFQQAK